MGSPIGHDSCGMKSLRYVLALVAAVLCTSHAGAVASGPANTTPSAATYAPDAAPTLVHQELALTPNAPLVIQFHTSLPLGPNTVAVLAYRPITLRDSLERAINHQLTGFVDRVDIDPTTVVTDAAGNLTITIPTETAADTAPALLLRDPGLYPLAVRVLDPQNKVVDELITFVARQRSEEDAPANRIGLAVLASVTAAPQIPGDKTPLPPDVAAQVAALAHYAPEVHLSLSLSPEILSRLDPDTIQSLRAALPNSVMMAQPYVPFDPSSATASGQQDRFTALLVDGENAVADVGGLARTDRSVWYAPRGITAPAATLLRELGVRLLVLPSETYLAADGNIGELTDYSQLFKTVLSGPPATSPETQDCDSSGALCIPTAVIDPVMSHRLGDAALAPEQASLYTAADVVVYREQFADSLSASNRHALVIGPDSDGVVDAKRVTRAVQMVSATDAVQFLTLDELQQSSSSLIVDGRPVELHLPQPAVADLTTRARSLNEVALAATTVSSMLESDNDPRSQRWSATVSTLFSTSVTDEQVTAGIATINHELAVIRACVRPPGTDTFTLTGRSTNLYLRIQNLCNEKLKVVVQLKAAADKMAFPDLNPVKVLKPLEVNDVPIPVVARTNGTFDVTLDLLTPDGAAKVTDSVTLKARINTLTGLPQLLTGAGLLILLTWWVRNLRRSRRQRRALAVAAAVSTSAHPAVQAEKAPPPRTS